MSKLNEERKGFIKGVMACKMISDRSQGDALTIKQAIDMYLERMRANHGEDFDFDAEQAALDTQWELSGFGETIRLLAGTKVN